VELPPTATWPNETLEGLAPKVSLVAPVPSSSTLRTEFEALLVNVATAPVHPVLVGEKVTFSATLFPAGRINGKANPDARNSVPPRFTVETVTLVGPLFVNDRT
jgi:hypothetical protein